MPSKTDSLPELLAQVDSLKSQIAALEATKSELEASAISEMQKAGVARHQTSEPGRGATLVSGSTVVVDERELLRRLTPEQADLVMVTALDRKLLEQAVADGHIDIDIVASCSDEKPRKPHIRFGPYRGEE